MGGGGWRRDGERESLRLVKKIRHASVGRSVFIDGNVLRG